MDMDMDMESNGTIPLEITLKRHLRHLYTGISSGPNEYGRILL